jgi:Na+/citrate or Na+/malate symporter
MGGNQVQNAESAARAGQGAGEGWWPKGWWSIVDFKIGIVPLPVFVILLAVIAAFAATGTVPSDILMAIVLLSMGGFTCAELGKRIPIIRNIGAAAIFATFIPSFLAFHHLLPASILGSVTQFTKDSNFLYLFISCIIVGSILGMDRAVLIKGFLKIFVPLAAGSVAGGVIGTLVGVLLGLGAYHTFFFIVVPIMAGGVGEGAIPLSIGYSQILHQAQGDLFAQVLPPVMLGSLTAILLAGTLNFVGKKYPHLTGEGRLQPGEHDEIEFEEDAADDHVDVTTVAAAVVTAVTLYLIGALTQRLFGFPAPVAMLAIAVVLKLTRAVSPSLQLGAFHVYKSNTRYAPSGSDTQRGARISFYPPLIVRYQVGRPYSRRRSLHRVRGGREVHAKRAWRIARVIHQSSDDELCVGAARILYGRSQIDQAARSFAKRFTIRRIDRHAVHEDRAQVAVLRRTLRGDIEREAGRQYRGQRGFSSSTAARAAALSVNHVASMAV